jgi:hypothetical protein
LAQVVGHLLKPHQPIFEQHGGAARDARSNLGPRRRPPFPASPGR